MPCRSAPRRQAGCQTAGGSAFYFPNFSFSPRVRSPPAPTGPSFPMPPPRRTSDPRSSRPASERSGLVTPSRITHHASLFTPHFCFLLSQFLLFGGPGFGLQTSTVPSVRCWKVSKVRSDTGLGARGRGAKGAQRQGRKGQADEGKRRKPLRLLHLCAFALTCHFRVHSLLALGRPIIV